MVQPLNIDFCEDLIQLLIYIDYFNITDYNVYYINNNTLVFICTKYRNKIKKQKQIQVKQTRKQIHTHTQPSEAEFIFNFRVARMCDMFHFTLNNIFVCLLHSMKSQLINSIQYHMLLLFYKERAHKI